MGFKTVGQTLAIGLSLFGQFAIADTDFGLDFQVGMNDVIHNNAENGYTKQMALGVYFGTEITNGYFFELEGYHKSATTIEYPSANQALRDASFLAMRLGKDFEGFGFEIYAGSGRYRDGDSAAQARDYTRKNFYGAIVKKQITPALSTSVLFGYADGPQATVNDAQSIRDFKHIALRADYTLSERWSAFGQFDTGRGVMDTDNDRVDLRQVAMRLSFRPTDQIELFGKASKSWITSSESANQFAQEMVISVGLNYQFRKSAYRTYRRPELPRDFLTWSAHASGGIK